VVSIGVGGFFGLCVVGNSLSLVATLWTRKGTSLIFPFFCGPICALACWFSPSPFLQEWFWVPLVADLSLLGLICIGVVAIVRLFRRSPPSGGI
jgi:hypothetical protein